MKEKLLNPQVITSQEFVLAGIFIETTLTKMEIPTLWKSFMPQRNIPGRIGEHVFSVSELINDSQWINFRPDTVHRKWACVQVKNRQQIPDSMHLLIIPSSKHFVFDYSGTPHEFGQVWIYLLSEYFPKENLQIDNRFQFEILNENLKYGMSNFSEKIFIPIK